MPTPKQPVVDPKWSEEETAAYMENHEAEYMMQMKGEKGLFMKAVETEMKADEDQTNYALKTFYKNWVKEGGGGKELLFPQTIPPPPPHLAYVFLLHFTLRVHFAPYNFQLVVFYDV